MVESLVRWVKELEGDFGKLGRHINHDPRSLEFDVAKVLPAQFGLAPLRSQVWKRAVPSWEQGKIGSCVGNSVCGLLMTEPFYMPSRILNEMDAVKVYSLASQLDPFPGQYPPDDTGTDGMSGMKAARRLGYIRAYYHIFDFNILSRYLAWVGPVIFGTNWYGGFDNVDSTGLCSFSGPNDVVRGGHEVELIGVDASAQTVRFCNSWGTDWGDHGCGQWKWDDFKRLMNEQGDLTVAIKV